MHAIRFPPDADPDAVLGCLREHGCAIVERLVPGAAMDRLEAELRPHLDAAPFGTDSILGKRTKRTGGLVARSPAARELVMNPTVLSVVGGFLSHATTYRLHCTQVIALHPGAQAQRLHQDEVAWDMYPFPDDYHVQCNTLWAMSDYTEEMGATRVVPGSHRAGRSAEFGPEDSIPAAMERGSVLLYDGKIYHGSGENRSDRVRRAVNITYAVGWVRQEENQYLSCPPEIAATLPEDLLRVMGYQCGAFALGYVNGFEDPLTILGRAEPGTLMGATLMRDAAPNADRASFLAGAEF